MFVRLFLQWVQVGSVLQAVRLSLIGAVGSVIYVVSLPPGWRGQSFSGCNVVGMFRGVSEAAPVFLEFLV